MRVYIVLKDWVDYCICGKQRIIDEFEVNNTQQFGDEVTVQCINNQIVMYQKRLQQLQQ